jgi:hypothetical protein
MWRTANPGRTPADALQTNRLKYGDACSRINEALKTLGSVFQMVEGGCVATVGGGAIRTLYARIERGKTRGVGAAKASATV